MTGPRCGQDSAAYVLGALEDRELDAFRVHLQSCSVCEAEVESFGALVDTLAMSVPQYQAPRGLRRRVVREVRQDVRNRAIAVSRPAVRRPLVPVLRTGWAAGVTMAVLLVAVVSVGLLAGRGHGRITSPFPPTSRTASSGARVISASVGAAQVVVQNGHGELVVRRLAPLPLGRVYEVWLVRGHSGPQPTSALFDVSLDGTAEVDVPGSMRTVTEILVTAEPAGGTAVPTGRAVIAAHVA